MSRDAGTDCTLSYGHLIRKGRSSGTAGKEKRRAMTRDMCMLVMAMPGPRGLTLG